MYAIQVTDQMPGWAWRIRGCYPKERTTIVKARDREQLRRRVHRLKETWRIDRVWHVKGTDY